MSKLGYRRGIIDISDGENTIKVWGYRASGHPLQWSNGLALVQDTRGHHNYQWTAIHAASGLAITTGPRFRTLADLKEFAEAIAPLVDWNKSSDELIGLYEKWGPQIKALLAAAVEAGKAKSRD